MDGAAGDTTGGGRYRIGVKNSLLRLGACVFIAACHGRSSPAPAPTLKVLVYNVHAGKDAKGVDAIERISDVVKSSGADIVFLQEVDKGTKRSGNVDQPAEYARRTGLHVAFGRSLDYDGGEYGIAMLSRWPIKNDTAIHLPVEPPQERSGGSHEPRVAMRATTTTPLGQVALLNTHIDASGSDVWRLQEIKTIIPLAKSFGGESGTPVLFGGDFNSTPDSKVQGELRASGMRDSWTTCGSGDGLSYPADKPVKRIDYLFLVGGVECTHSEVLVSEASDHRPVLFTIRPWNPASGRM